jgi:hypothetical protein
MIYFTMPFPETAEEDNEYVGKEIQRPFWCKHLISIAKSWLNVHAVIWKGSNKQSSKQDEVC